MKLHPLFVTVALIACTVLLAACESDDGIARRERERPAAYAALHVWQKRFIEQGVIAKGFTPDMVYMAMGVPSNTQHGNNAELWTYKYYYPRGDLSHERFHYYSEVSMHDHNIVLGTAMEGGGGATAGTPRPMGSAPGGATPFAFRPGPPQGGSMEPADLQSYKMQVLFENGKVTQIGVQENVN